MTVALGVVGCALAVLLAGFGARLGEASEVRARAQAAADAAALAAAAESGPYGRGLHKLYARRFAEMNGARLAECLCPPGATAVQVEVVLEGVRARARAVIDPDLLRPALPHFDQRGLDPRLAAEVARLLDEAGGAVTVVSGYRSAAEQSVLWAAALRRYGSRERADDWVARPGTSMHERGLAVDLGGDLDLAVEIIDRLNLPLHRPLPNESWHFELTADSGLTGSRR